MEADGGHLSVSPGQLMAATETGETGSGALDGLVALVGGINEALNGDSSAKSAPIYAGVMINAPEASVAASVPIAPIALAGASTSNLAPVESSASNVAPVESAPASEPGQLLASVDAAATVDPPKKKFSWKEALAWLKAAESAYEEGNLKEFIEGEAE